MKRYGIQRALKSPLINNSVSHPFLHTGGKKRKRGGRKSGDGRA